ncbi:hypothetical protein ASE93_10495 [Serratia sp. Leaf50]|nr:hypothetical protein ASE93_10495 [Serratia sp. Leaf50]
MKSLRFWLLAAGFDLWWTLAVWGRESVEILLVIGALLMLYFTPAARRKWVIFAFVIGVAMDSLWCASGLLAFEQSQGVPVWMVALWLSFSAWWLWFYQQISLRWPWLILLGAVSGPLAYYVGMRFDAMYLLAPPWQVFSLMAVGWACFLPLISYGVRQPHVSKRSP